MSLRVKAGTPEGVHAFIPKSIADQGEEIVREVDTTLPIIAGTEGFLNAMEEGFSTGETSQRNPFNTPEFKKANSETLAGRMQELVRGFRLMLVALFLPSGYEVVESGPFMDVKEFCEQARRFWDAYEPLLGRGNTVTVLQVEAPAELEED